MESKPIVIANWKLGLDHEQSVVLAGQIANSEKELLESASIIICPSAISLLAVEEALGDTSKILLGVQNVHAEELGAFTGETSIIAASQLGAKYVIIGHSERRKHFHETDQDVALKVALAIRNNVIPILCVGETYEDRKKQRAELVVTEELERAVKNIKLPKGKPFIIAYEPIWAIGTGQAINPEQAKLMGMVIHQKMIDLLPKDALSHMHVVYGGSVDAENIASFVDGRVISGVLVGGASQQFNSFRALVKALKKA